MTPTSFLPSVRHYGDTPHSTLVTGLARFSPSVPPSPVPDTDRISNGMIMCISAPGGFFLVSSKSPGRDRCYGVVIILTRLKRLCCAFLWVGVWGCDGWFGSPYFPRYLYSYASKHARGEK